jgi:hypothetical protein
MERVLMALTAGVMLASFYPAWGGESATLPDRQAPPADPAEFEIVAVVPRSPDAKPVLSSLPAGGSDRQVAERSPGPDAVPVAKPGTRMDEQ